MPADITTGLVEQWLCNDNAASTTVVATVGTNGTLTNAGNTSASSIAGPTNSLLATALNLDGVNDFISGPTIQGPQTACSIAAWVKPTSTGVYVVASLISNATITGPDAAYMQFYVQNLGVHFRIHQGTNSALAYIGRQTAISSLTAGVWTHIVGTWDGTTTSAGIKIYVAGVQVDNANDAGGSFTAPNTASIPFWVGSQDIGSGTFPFSGGVSDVRLYSRALVQIDINALIPWANLALPITSNRDIANPILPTSKARRLAALSTPIQNRLTNLLNSQDTFYSDPGVGPDYDYPNPTRKPINRLHASYFNSPPLTLQNTPLALRSIQTGGAMSSGILTGGAL